MQPFNTEQEINTDCHEVVLDQSAQEVFKIWNREEPTLLSTPSSPVALLAVAARRSQDSPQSMLASKTDTGSLPHWGILLYHAGSAYLPLLIFTAQKGKLLEWKRGWKGNQYTYWQIEQDSFSQAEVTEPREIPQMFTDQGNEISYLAPGTPLLPFWQS